MPAIEVSIPDQLDSEIDRLVEAGEFINREQAIEELISQGISVFATADDEGPEVEENLFTQAVEDQQDPAMQSDDRNDEYGF